MVIIGRFVNKYALVHLRGAYLEVYLGGMLSENRLLDVLGRYGALRLHLPRTKSPIHYLVDPKALIFISEMRNVISHRNQTKRTNTDARTSPKAFFEPTHSQQIPTHELGGMESLNYSIWRLGNMGDL